MQFYFYIAWKHGCGIVIALISVSIALICPVKIADHGILVFHHLSGPSFKFSVTLYLDKTDAITLSAVRV